MTKLFETPISFLKPESLVRAEQAYISEQISTESLKAAQDEEITKLVEAERAHGLGIITDGGFRNGLEGRDFWMGLQGVTPTVVTSGHVYQDQNAGEVIPRVTSKLAHNPSHNILNNFSFLQGKVGDALFVRMDIPAPSQFLVELVRNGWYDTTVYLSLDELATDIASAYRSTLLVLYKAGCRRILLVDPSWGRLCDPYASKRLLQGGIDLIALPRIMRKTNDEAMCDLPQDMHMILYAPVAAQIHDHCDDVVNEVLSHARVDSYMFDWQEDDKGIMPFISQVPANKEIIIGIGDTKEPQLDDIEYIKAVIDKVSKANPGISVRISTKGGFINNTDTIDFSSITEVDQWNKIRNLMDLS